ncbi:hypothetical protein ABZ553_27885 [Streptomyces sparsogenes]|uniref:hypothetical protein n=1 Tax=Streptomyces sparsogenes TaxID=67365 RepID=UPI0033EBC5CD
MKLSAVERASCGLTEEGPDDLEALPDGTSSDAAIAALRSRQFGRGLHVTRVARHAVAKLRAGAPELAEGGRLGLILATERGDQAVLARRTADVARQMSLGERAPTDLFRAIAYFPVGRVARSVAEKLRAWGPVASVPADLDRARTLAEVWLSSGRAEQVVLVAADPTADGATAHATAELWLGAPRTDAAPSLAVASFVKQTHQSEGVSCAELAGQVIGTLAPVSGRRTALVVGSMLADAGESLFAEICPRDPGPPLAATVRSLAGRLGFSEVFVLVGSSGACMTALGLAQDLIALDQVDSAVVCGVDLVHGALAQGLGLLRCDDLPHMRGGASALLLQPAAPDGGRPILQACSLASPPIPPQSSVAMDLAGVPTCLANGRKPSHVVLSGLSSLDLECAEQLAGHVWPDAPISSRGDMRGVGDDVLHLAGTASSLDLPMGIAGVHSLGGTGCCLLT